MNPKIDKRSTTNDKLPVYLVKTPTMHTNKRNKYMCLVAENSNYLTFWQAHFDA